MSVYGAAELPGDDAAVALTSASGKPVRAMAVVAVDSAGNNAPAATASDPAFVRAAQDTPTHTPVTLVANTAATIVAPSAAVNGARVLNWTASPVYVAPGTSGTPASGAPSDYIPAASGGVPGQYEPPYAPTTGLRAVGASAGALTVETW